MLVEKRLAANISHKVLWNCFAILTVPNSCLIFSVCVVLKFLDSYVAAVYDKRILSAIVGVETGKHFQASRLDFDSRVNFFSEYLLLEKIALTTLFSPEKESKN